MTSPTTPQTQVPVIDDHILAALIEHAAHGLPFNNAPGSETRIRTLALLLAALCGGLSRLDFHLSTRALEAVLFGPPSSRAPVDSSDSRSLMNIPPLRQPSLAPSSLQHRLIGLSNQANAAYVGRKRRAMERTLGDISDQLAELATTPSLEVLAPAHEATLRGWLLTFEDGTSQFVTEKDFVSALVKYHGVDFKTETLFSVNGTVDAPCDLIASAVAKETHPAPSHQPQTEQSE